MDILKLFTLFWLPLLLHNFFEASADEVNGKQVDQSNETTNAKNWKNWKTGKEIASRNVPVVFDEKGEISIYADQINGALPELVKLYFNDAPPNTDRRTLTMQMCVVTNCEPNNCCKLTVCYVGQMNPANGPLNSRFELENFEKSEIAAKCRRAQKKSWPQFGDKVLHGFELSYYYLNKSLMVSTSFNPISQYFAFNESNVTKCIDVILGENGYLDGYVQGERKKLDETYKVRQMHTALLSMENGITALAYDFLAGIPQGGAFGIIGDGGAVGAASWITLMGDGLYKCKGKQCKDSMPK
ncbi:hypothetical protein niasHT_021899 [Heterodera trifolii]|uniref:Effector protein n=1 Tax=Heterodera trifolii TaxID=157864 RepID=A0ABD2K8U5_9BILA